MTSALPPPDKTAPPPTGVEAEARAWMAYLLGAEHTPDKDKKLELWLAASPDHRRALEGLRAGWMAIAEVEGVEDILSAPARIAVPRAGRPAAPSRQRRRLVAGLLAAAACGVALIFVAPLMQTAPTEDIYLATAIGEIRTFDLSDGSRLTLDAGSEVKGRFTRDQRSLTLVEGNAYFDIARAPERPLDVRAGDVQVKVLGTQFDIRRRPAETIISVEEGHVAVTGAQGLPAVSLTGGLQVTYRTGKGFDASATFDAARSAAWRRGQLYYVDARLGDIIDDVNRYSARPITLADQTLGDLRLTMSFSVNQIEIMLAGLDEAYPLDINYTSSEIHIYSVSE